MKQHNVVQKIWSLCNILRGDGITYYQYIAELSYLLFLKIARENGSEELIPEGFRWADLDTHGEDGLLGFYQEMLTHLGATAGNEVVRTIYAFPTTVFSHSANLKAVISGISKIDWHQVDQDGFGDIYSGLIDKSAQDTRSGAGQYFTPRPLVEMIVTLMQPKVGELIQDPSVGSGGFLVAADEFIRRTALDEDYRSNPPKYQGVEIEKNTRRICLMNTFLHGLNADIIYGDALTDDAKALESADLILANPPFGSKAGSKRSMRKDIPFPNCNKQLAFLQHIYLGLKEGGRAAVVLPDNILFEEGVGRAVRQHLMQVCNLHTILRLPTGIFYAAGVKTNVLFFSKEKGGGTNNIWIYDMRVNMPRFGKTTPLELKHFKDFVENFGDDPHGKSPRKELGRNANFRCFTREEVANRNDNLDISWISEDEAANEEGLTELEEISAAIIRHLRSALVEIEAVDDEFAESIEVEE
ncbi:class I SAM-dependent DNA methyltransferase [Pseudomonas sp. RIT288]|uniref:class I SAM-dependent DNA methyltransferase n=1 Tax=Pseudomonas sp. RIT288 TaxID=1470589 RepID=UPI000449F52B|nr:N-6 DNA methylase [Pseudomonas sp. RIT288]EZP31292.1 type I restriction-modification system, M subunit [Pseudomonas sp. RIT288]